MWMVKGVYFVHTAIFGGTKEGTGSTHLCVDRVQPVFTDWCRMEIGGFPDFQYLSGGQIGKGSFIAI